MIQMNLFIKQKQTHRLRKQTYGYQRGKVVGRGINWEFGTDTFKFLIYLFIYGCIGSSLLCADFSCGERGLLFIVACSLLIAVASFVVEHGL